MSLATADKDDSNVAESTVATSTEKHDNVSKTLDQYPSSWKLAMILLSLALGTLLMAIDTTIISVAIPKISTEFKALKDVGWYGSAYLITLTAFQPVTGNAYKMFNPRIVYIVFIIIFEVGSILCAAATSSPMFIVGRAIAGVGAAGLIQGALGIITYIAPLEKRPLYMAIVISVFGISSCASPTLGGVLTDRVGWRWCFWINVPTGAVVLGLVLVFLRLKGIDQTSRSLPIRAKLLRMDPIGIILLVGAVCCLFLALQVGGHTSPWRSPTVIGLFIGFGLLIIVFGTLQWRLGENATIPLRFLRQRTVFMGSIFLFCINMSNYMKLYYLPFYFQSVRGDSAIRSGVEYIPLALPQLVGIIVSGGLITKFGYYIPIILFGEILCAIGTGLLTTIGLTTPTVAWAAFLVLVGFGLGMGINAPHIAIQAVFPSENDVFVANGVATFFSQLGGSIAISIGDSLLLNGLTRSLPQYTTALSPQTVIGAGALGVTSLTNSPTVLQGIRQAYATAIRDIFIFDTAIVCISIPIACGMQWLNVVKVSKQREAERGGEGPGTGPGKIQEKPLVVGEEIVPVR